MQNILLPYQNKIVAQIFLHSSEGGFRQHITRNVRILDNLNFFQPNHKRSSSIKGGLQSKVIFQQRLASIKDLLPVCCRMFQNVPIPPATFIISLEANCHIQTGGKIHLQGHKLMLYTKKKNITLFLQSQWSISCLSLRKWRVQVRLEAGMPRDNGAVAVVVSLTKITSREG